MNRLKPNHVKLLDLLADLNDGRSDVEKCIEAGFSGTYVYELLKKPEFQRELRERTDAGLGAGRPRVLGAVKKKAEEGDMKAAEIYLKATGDITGGTNVTTNITQTNANNEDFSDKIRDRFAERTVAAKRDRFVPTDEG